MPAKSPGVGEHEPPNWHTFTIDLGRLIAGHESLAQTVIGLNEEAKVTSRAVIVGAQAVETIGNTVRDLVRVVKDGNGHDSVLAQLYEVKTALRVMQERIDALASVDERLEKEVRDVGVTRLKLSGGWSAIAIVAILLGWLITTGVAIYAARGGH